MTLCRSRSGSGGRVNIGCDTHPWGDVKRAVEPAPLIRGGRRTEARAPRSRRRRVETVPVDFIDAALQALAERGEWHGPGGPDVELNRIELRRAARKAGVCLRTFVDRQGRLHAITPDGYPANEPWRGAAIHAHDSGAESQAAAAALGRLFRSHGR